VRRVATAEGLGTLRQSALRLVFEAQTTLHEINRVTFVEEIEDRTMSGRLISPPGIGTI
jgi:type IV pilus assembly protein PilB